MPFFSRSRHSMAFERRLCCGLEKNGIVGAWHWYGMASVNQTRSHCVNQMGKTLSKPLTAWHGRGTAWARRGLRESALRIKPLDSFRSYKNFLYIPLRSTLILYSLLHRQRRRDLFLQVSMPKSSHIYRPSTSCCMLTNVKKIVCILLGISPASEV